MAGDGRAVGENLLVKVTEVSLLVLRHAAPSGNGILTITNCSLSAVTHLTFLLLDAHIATLALQLKATGNQFTTFEPFLLPFFNFSLLDILLPTTTLKESKQIKET